MSKLVPFSVAALLCTGAPFFGVAMAQAPAQNEEVELNPAEPVYTNCQYRFAVIYPGGTHPMIRDVTFTTPSGATVPAKQFYVEQGGDRFSVTVVEFPSGPAVDEQIVEHAAQNLRQRGEVRFQAAAPYDPGMPGRQLNVFYGNGRQLRASVYMADGRLTITEADAPVGSFPALQFEQSITLIDANGEDLDRANPGAVQRVFPCA